MKSPAMVEIERDRHSHAQGVVKGNAETRASTGGGRYRRPTRGIQLNGDTFATLEVVTPDPANSGKFIDAGAAPDKGGVTATSLVYSNFMLQSVAEERMEKQQILETFGEPYIFFFGERPRIMSFQGVLLNTYDFNWEAEWWANYDAILRGTKCVEMDARVYLTFDHTVIGGYVLSTSSQKVANERNHVSFGFQLYVTSWATMTRLGDPRSNPEANERNGQVLAPSQRSVGRITQTDLLLGGAGTEGLAGILNGDDFSAKVDENGFIESALTAAADAALNGKYGLRAIDAFLTKAQRTVANIFSGDTVRMPAGVAGELAYKELSKKITMDAYTAGDATHTGKITYTTFSDNTDEFVSGRPLTLKEETQLAAVQAINQGMFSVERQWDTPGGVAARAQAQMGWAQIDSGAYNQFNTGPLSAALLSETLYAGLTMWSLKDPEGYASVNSAMSQVGLIIAQATPPSTLSGVVALTTPRKGTEGVPASRIKFGFNAPTSFSMPSTTDTTWTGPTLPRAGS